MVNVEFFQKMEKACCQSIEDMKIRIRDKNGDLAGIVGLLRINYMILGMIEACYKAQYRNSKINFFKASKMQEWCYNAYKSQQYNIEKEEVSTYSYETLYFDILSGNKKQCILMANYMGSLEEASDLVYSLLGYSLKYVVLDDENNAMKYINQLEENKSKRGMKQYAEGHARAFRGLVQRNEMEFNNGLEFMLKHHVARMKRDGRKMDQYFAYDSVALAMLAKERGMSITVKHELLPEGYLEESNIDYDAIEILV